MKQGPAYTSSVLNLWLWKYDFKFPQAVPLTSQMHAAVYTNVEMKFGKFNFNFNVFNSCVHLTMLKKFFPVFVFETILSRLLHFLLNVETKIRRIEYQEQVIKGHIK